MAKDKYKLESDLSENQVEAFVSAYLGWSSHTVPVLLLSTDEQKTGADKECHNVGENISVIYIQFKKSLGLKTINDYSRVNANAGKENQIRQFRDTNKFTENRILYFQLRRKAKNAKDFQHNILKAHHNPQNAAYAIYVAPLHLMKQDYEFALFNNSNYRYTASPFVMKNGITQSSLGTLSVENTTPFLREHVSIIPHVKVQDHKHFYAYSDTGMNITWHSPEVLKQEEPSNLQDFLNHVLSERTEKISLEQLATHVKAIGNEYGFKCENKSPLEILKKYDKWLYDNHQIKQFIFVF